MQTSKRQKNDMCILQQREREDEKEIKEGVFSALAKL
jgi:hypothetical protein